MTSDPWPACHLPLLGLCNWRILCVEGFLISSLHNPNERLDQSHDAPIRQSIDVSVSLILQAVISNDSWD